VVTTKEALKDSTILRIWWENMSACSLFRRTCEGEYQAARSKITWLILKLKQKKSNVLFDVQNVSVHVHMQ
jgi:hypothetical protein